MDKSIVARRKAQQMARDGQISRAIEEMERIIQSGEIDPYDFVFHGDLLVRGGRQDDAVAIYEEAVTAYERIGLFRNAIAICKKLIRLRPAHSRAHRRLGDLYAKEGLLGDAVAQFLIYLDRADGDAPAEEFIETLERVSEIAGSRVEVKLRLADLYAKAGHEEKAAMLLGEVAEQAAGGGGEEIAQALRERARRLVAEPSPQAETSHTEPVPAPEDSSFVFQLDNEIDAEAARDAGADAPETPVPAEDSAADPMRLLDEALGQADWTLARTRGEALHAERPDDLALLEKLVLACESMGDRLATVGYLILLGDLKIREEDLEGALQCFLQVLDLDPGNATAHRRLERFRGMNLLDVPDRQPVDTTPGIREVLAAGEATVTVREHGGGSESGEWVDLVDLLQRFQDGVKGLLGRDDYAGHYDLGVSHQEMGLFEEAIEEFDTVLGMKNVPRRVLRKAQEMRGLCLQNLQRHWEAIAVFREALEMSDGPQEDRSALDYHLACSLESVGETIQARDLFFELSQREVAFLDSAARYRRLAGSLPSSAA